MPHARVTYAALLLFAISPLVAEPLSQADIEELRERLKAIREGAGQHMDKRFKNALDDFRAALTSGEAATELYLKCVEKADFEDQQKKSQDFRNWKRDQEDQLKDSTFREALRHQLNWLCLMMRANARPAEVSNLAPDAAKAMEDLFSDAEAIEGQAKLLGESVQDSVFVRAYELGTMDEKLWPGSPMKTAEVFDKVIMPALRSPKKITQLDEMWETRIQTEIAKADFIDRADKPNALSRMDKLSPAMTEFREQTLPNLRWMKQVDLFKAGDQQKSALRMLKHVQENIENVKANEWIDEFQKLIAPEEAPVPGNPPAAPKP